MWLWWCCGDVNDDGGVSGVGGALSDLFVKMFLAVVAHVMSTVYW